MTTKRYKPKKATRVKIEREILGRATPEECEHAATLAYSMSETAKSNTSKAAFDLLAALAGAYARGEIVATVTMKEDDPFKQRAEDTDGDEPVI